MLGALMSPSENTRSLTVGKPRAATRASLEAEDPLLFKIVAYYWQKEHGDEWRQAWDAKNAEINRSIDAHMDAARRSRRRGSGRVE